MMNAILQMSHLPKMTNHTRFKIRQAFGWCAMVGAMTIATLTGYRAHQNTQRAQALFSERQDVIFSAIESENYPLCVIDDSGKVILWNAAMEILTGLTRAEAVKGGFEAIMCDPVKKQQHHKGQLRAFADTKRDGAKDTVVVVNCSILNVKTHERIPVRINVRMITAGPDRTAYAFARIDRDSQIQEYGKPSAERAPPKRVTN